MMFFRYRKKVEKDEDYIRTVANLGAAVEGLVKQNNVVDIYQEYFTGVMTDHSAEVKSVLSYLRPKAPSQWKCYSRVVRCQCFIPI